MFDTNKCSFPYPIMEPDENIKKLLRVKFSGNDSYFDIKVKLVALEKIICNSTDQNVTKGAFTKILNLFISRNKTIKRACIPHFRNIKGYISTIDQDITQLFHINDEDVLRLVLRFIKIFAKFYCNDNIVIYHVMLSKNKYKYKVLNSLMKRNINLLGLFEYSEILEREYQIDRKEIICYQKIDKGKLRGKKRKRRKLNEDINQVKETKIKSSKGSKKYLLGYLDTVNNLKAFYLEKNKTNMIEFLKVGEFEQFENLGNIFNGTVIPPTDLKVTNSCLNLKDVRNKESLVKRLQYLKLKSTNFKDKAIYGYFEDLLEKDKDKEPKYVFDVQDCHISSSFIVKLHALFCDEKYMEIEKKYVKLSKK